MLKLFNTNKPVILFFLFFVSIVVWMPGLMDTGSVTFSGNAPLFNGLRMLSQFTVWQGIVVFLVALAGGFLLNYVVIKHQLLTKNTNLVAAVYIFLFGIVAQACSLNPVVFANLFLILALDRTLTVYNQHKVYQYCFHVGLLIGVAAHFYTLSILFLLLFFAGLIIIRTFDWRDWAITFMGLIIPFMYSWTTYFWFDNLDEYFKSFYFSPGFFTASNSFSLFWYQKISYLLFAILGIVNLITLSRKTIIRHKNLLTLVLIYFCICVVILFLNTIDLIEFYLLSLIPLSIMLAALLQSIRKNWMAEGIFVLLVVATLTTILIRFL